MKHYIKRTVQFALFGLVGFLIYNFWLRFIEPVTQAEITMHTIATSASLLLGAIGFLGAAYFSLASILCDEGQEGSEKTDGNDKENARCSVKKQRCFGLQERRKEE